LDTKGKNEVFEPSSLGERISKTGNILNNSANLQIEEYHRQVHQNAILYKKLVKNLIIDAFDNSDAFATSKEFFNKDSIRFVAVDGTEYAKQFFDMVIFYAGAYSCSGTLDFIKENGKIKASYEEKHLEKGREISSCVPIYTSKIPEIDKTLYDSQNQASSFLNLLSEEWILDNTEISKALMTFSEFFLAYTIAASKQTNIIFMDRSLSNMYSSLFAATSKNDDWSESSLLNYVIDNIPIDVNDLSLAQHYVQNESLQIPPPRGDYLGYSIFFKILENEPTDLKSLCGLLGIQDDDEKGVEKTKKYTERLVKEQVIIRENNSQYKISEKYKSTWPRTKKLVKAIGNQVFKSERDPFIITKDTNGQEKKEWITTTDLSLLTLFTLYMLIEECWKNNILLVGITKDTVARDFSNHLLQIGNENSFWDVDKTDEDNETTSNGIVDTIYSDRMLLQTISLLNHESLKVPWSIIEYDSAFVMAIPDREKRKGYVSGAIKNKITTNKLFLRSFVQIGQAKTESRLRSNVLFIDRLVYPQFDIQQYNNNTDNIVELVHEYGSEEKVDFILYRDKSTKNPMQNLILSILSSMTSPSIPECFGHNKALYVADKVAKWHNEEFRKIVDSTILLISTKKNLRNFLFYMNTFREKRHDFESNR
jgi:hypothetical protein